jgi:hypothetical protein
MDPLQPLADAAPYQAGRPSVRVIQLREYGLSPSAKCARHSAALSVATSATTIRDSIPQLFIHRIQAYNTLIARFSSLFSPTNFAAQTFNHCSHCRPTFTCPAEWNFSNILSKQSGSLARPASHQRGKAAYSFLLKLNYCFHLATKFGPASLIEEDLENVEQKSEEVNCNVLYDAVIATIKLIYDSLFCSFTKNIRNIQLYYQLF